MVKSPAKKGKGKPVSKMLKADLVEMALNENKGTKTELAKMKVPELRNLISGGIVLEKEVKKVKKAKTVKKTSTEKKAPVKMLKAELVVEAVGLGHTEAAAKKKTVKELREIVSAGIVLEKPAKKSPTKKKSPPKKKPSASPKAKAKPKAKEPTVAVLKTQAKKLGYTDKDFKGLKKADIIILIESGPKRAPSPKKTPSPPKKKKSLAKKKTPKKVAEKKPTKASLVKEAKAMGFDPEGWSLVKLKRVVGAGEEAKCYSDEDWRKCGDDEFCSYDDGRCYPSGEAPESGIYLEAPGRANIYSSSLETLEALKKVIKGSKIVKPAPEKKKTPEKKTPEKKTPEKKTPEKKTPEKKKPTVKPGKKPSSPAKKPSPPKVKPSKPIKKPSVEKKPSPSKSKPTPPKEPSEAAKMRQELLAKFAECLEKEFKAQAK
jgi:hypothetical protein